MTEQHPAAMIAASQRPAAYKQASQRSKRTRRYKQFLLGFGALSVLLAAVIIGLVYIMDPLQFYRKATFYTPILSTQERYQNPGLAKNYSYDTIIIGSSMTENFLPSQLGSLFGGTAMKLSMEGSTAAEQRMIAKLALDTGQVNRVIWGVDYFALKSDIGGEQGDFPSYLYDHNSWNDIAYLFNITTLEDALQGWAGSLLSQSPEITLDTRNNWDRTAEYGKSIVLDKWEKALQDEFYYGQNEDSLDKVKLSFEQNIEALITEYPQTEFLLYYPPYSILRHQVWRETNPLRYENQFVMKKLIFEQLSKLPNVRIFDFQSVADITFDLDLYKDLSHHSQAVNERIAKDLAANRYLVTETNLEAGIQLLQQQVDELVVSEEQEVYSLQLQSNDAVMETGLVRPVKDGEVMVQLKGLPAFIQAQIVWDSATQTAAIQRNGHRVVLQLGSASAEIDGVKVASAHPAVSIENRTYVPLRQTVEWLGGRVTDKWSGAYERKLEVRF